MADRPTMGGLKAVRGRVAGEACGRCPSLTPHSQSPISNFYSHLLENPGAASFQSGMGGRRLGMRRGGRGDWDKW